MLLLDHTRQKRLFAIALFVTTISICSMSTASFASTTSSVSNVKSVVKVGTVDTSAEQDFLNRTNALRASLGVGSLKINSELLTKARNWSQTQANSGTIFHSTLTDGVSQNWQSLGENVGMGPDVLSIHNALVASPRHYQNLVDPRFTDVGIGVVNQNGTIYVSQVFMQLMPTQATPPQTTPATSPQKSSTPAAQKTSTKSSSPKGSAQSSTPTTTAPTNNTVAESAPFKTASQELTDVIAKLHALEN